MRVGEGKQEGVRVEEVAARAVPWARRVATKNVSFSGLNHSQCGSFVIARSMKRPT